MTDFEDRIIEGEINQLKRNKGISLLSLKDILSTDYGPDLWTVEKLVPEGSITAISGAPGSFKTWLTLDLAKSVASGSKFLEMFRATQGNVLFIDKENRLKHIQKRMNQLNVSSTLPIYYYSPSDSETFSLDKSEHLENLLEVITNLNIKLVIFDSLARMHYGDENEVKHMSQLMNAFRVITNKGSSVIFIHHNRKESAGARSNKNSVRGSSDIVAGIDCLISVSRPENESYIKVTQVKLRQDQEIEPFAVSVSSNKEADTISFAHSGSFDPSSEKIEVLKKCITELLTTNSVMTRAGFTEHLSLDYSTSVISKGLKELEEEGGLVKTVGAHNQHSYSLKGNN